ncbi:MAG: UDP-N-acetylglucosamine 2-epimerase (non-hydrolyzing) [Myxococcales bacterium]|nr:MAG: UDP-N-acetylglucosamine 2-epimerase (non-hydrolyzing) [Myxococcales bacterium]
MAAGKTRIIATIVGARPQFIKLAAVNHVLRQRSGMTEVVIHTGQHYDDPMSAAFFRELDLPEPAINLGVSGGGHGRMTGRMLEAIEAALVEIKPAGVLVYGDTNSTLAGALAAAKLHLPVAHVEAGLRSFNKAMPEEINRRLADHCADLLFCPTRRAVDQLRSEGVVKGVHFTGDVMYDLARRFERPDPQVLRRLDAPAGGALVTLHRQENTDEPRRLAALAEALVALSRELPVFFPLHPRTRAALKRAGLFKALAAACRLAEPIGYIELQSVLRASRLVLTDSGGLQKEAYFARVPCVTLRDETEWPETLEGGANRVAGASPKRIRRAVKEALATRVRPKRRFGDGRAAERIVAWLEKSWRTP